jgi:hypothetical protein
MWKGWKVSESQKFFSNLIDEIKMMQEAHRRDGKVIFNITTSEPYYTTITFQGQTILYVVLEQVVK